MNTTKKITLMNGDWNILIKNAWKNTNDSDAKYRRKKFVRIVKRTMAGPVFGFWLSFISIQFLGLNWMLSVVLGLAITIAGLFQRFRYVKYSYLILVVLLYVFLIEQMIAH